jgi:hypothetical protein
MRGDGEPRWTRRDSGQVLALFAGCLATLLIMAAFTIDAGHAWWARRALQSGADAAAIAGAHELPNVGAATSVAMTYSGDAATPGALNKAVPETHATASAICFGGGSCPAPNAVRVVQTAEVQTFFWRVFGRDSYDVSASAVAKKTQTAGGSSAIYVNEACGNKGLKFNGQGMNIQGAVHSNGNFEVDANTFTSGPATIHRPQSSCITKPPPTKSGITFAGANLATQEPAPRPWPVTFSTAQFCDGPHFGPNGGNDYTVSKSYTPGATMASGVYCALNGKFELDVVNIKGTITVVAREIIINAQGSQLQPFKNNVILFQSGAGYELKINTSDWTWTGYIYSPSSHVVVNGSAATAFTGFIVAKSVLVNGAGFKMIGTGPSGGGTSSVALVE